MIGKFTAISTSHSGRRDADVNKGDTAKQGSLEPGRHKQTQSAKGERTSKGVISCQKTNKSTNPGDTRPKNLLEQNTLVLQHITMQPTGDSGCPQKWSERGATGGEQIIEGKQIK